MAGVEGAEQPGFERDCAKFAQDPLLRDFWLARNEAAPQSPILAAMVPRLSVSGTALATYDKQLVYRTASNLETLFGITQPGQREVVEATFQQEARSVMLYPNVIATVAHALTPDIVEVQLEQQRHLQTVPLHATGITVTARALPGEDGVIIRLAHLNESYDLALAQARGAVGLQPFAYPAVLSYGTGDPGKPVGGLLAGDCVAALVTVRDAEEQDTGKDRLIVGKVLAKGPVATNSMTQTKLNVNMFTTDLDIKPGDSGSPVLALREGKPVLVGLISSTMYPTATFTYVTRIDPLLALADALRVVGARQP
jgi:hypothetical protein